MYRTIESSIWTDPKFRALPAPGKLLFLYLITNPHAHVSGIYYLPDVTVVHESSVRPESIDAIWDTLSKSELAWRDQKSEVVWVKNMFKHQGVHEKLILSTANHLQTLHKSFLIGKFLDYYPIVSKALKRKGIDRVSRSRPKEQEQEKDQEKDKEAAPLVDEIDGQTGQAITAETVYRAYPKHVDPEPSKKAISLAVHHLRKQCIPEPWKYLLGRVRMYADARKKLNDACPGENKFIPACHRWMKRKRYEEDPVDWIKEGSGPLRPDQGFNGRSRSPQSVVAVRVDN